MANTRATTGFTQFIPQYWDTLFGENLYPNLFLYSFGMKRTLPRNFGLSIKIPRLRKQNIVAAVTEYGSVITPNALSGQFVSGTLQQFGGAYAHSDLVIMTALSDVIELSLRDIARDIAKRMDTHIRDTLSGIGAFVGGSGAASGSVATASVLKTSDIAKAVVLLDGGDNPRPPDGYYPLLTHPYALFGIQTTISANAWLEVNKYTSNEALGNVYRAEAGRLFGAKVLTSSNVKTRLGGAAAGGFSADASGWRSMMFAPEAYYVTEISDMTAKTFVKQLGSAGAADPINQFATVGAKVFFTAIPANWGSEVRMIRVTHGGRTPS